MLSKFSVKKPYTVVVAVILVLLLGVISFLNLQTDLLPEIDLPYLVVNTQYQGASPEEVEQIVTNPIEQIVATTNNIKNVNSISSEGSSTVILEFSNDANMDSAIIEINGALDLIKGAWGEEVSSPFIIRLNPDMLPVMIASVDIDNLDISEVSRIVKNDIMPELESVNGVAAVDPVGIVEEKIEVSISEEKIEVINKKILDNVDKELSQAEDELLEGKNEIESNLADLEAEEESQIQTLNQGEEELNLAKSQIGEGLAEMIRGESELISARAEIERGVDELNSQITKLETGDFFIQFAKGILPQSQMEDFKQYEAALEQLKAKKEEANQGIKTINESLSELRSQKGNLESQRLELVEKSNELSQGKMALQNELRRAKEGLNEGKALLDENLEKLEEQKEEAFKNASLEGVITKDMISGIITAQNFSMPAGYVEEDNKDYVVKVGDKIADVDEMKNLVLFDSEIEEIGKIKLEDVSDIGYIDNSDDIYAKVNGNNAIMLSFQKQSNFSTSDVSDSINQRITRLKENNVGLNVVPLLDQGEYIDIVVDSVLNNILYGGLLAILILFIFLRDIKPTITIAFSVPISIVFAVTLMYFSGVTLNMISLAGLALGVGMLVDNSIVVIENIYRLRSQGASAFEASIEGAREVSGAIFASTLTTACVFLPIVFTSGLSRQLFVDMGLTIAYSLFASLIVALTLVPMLTSTVLKSSKEKEKNIFNKLVNVYEKILIWTLSHKTIILLLVIILLIGSGYFAVDLGTSFIPDMDAPQMSATIEIEEDASMDEVREITDETIKKINGIKDINTIGAFKSSSLGGFGGPGGGGGGNNISLYILLNEDKEKTNIEIGEQIKELTKDLDVEISVTESNMDMSQIGGEGVEILVKGRDLDTLREIAGDIAKTVEKTEGIIEVSDGIEDTSLELRVRVDKERAIDEGLTVAQVYSALNKILSSGRSTTTLSLKDKDYPVIVVEERNENLTKSDLENIMIESSETEAEIELGEIALIEEAQGLASITRESQERYLSVSGKIHPDYNIGLVGREVEESLNEYVVPEGYSLEFKGENETINDSLRDLVYMLLLAIVFIYLIMVAQFQSLLSPFIIMFTIPLAFTGGLMALIITGNEISLIAMLGFLVLAGIVVNNGIVFVDYTNQLRQKGYSVEDALITTGKTRLRPILMTAITTILGLSTLSLGVGIGSEVIQPLAIVAIGGLIYATILTLLVVPVMYRLFNKDKEIKDKGENYEI